MPRITPGERIDPFFTLTWLMPQRRRSLSLRTVRSPVRPGLACRVRRSLSLNIQAPNAFPPVLLFTIQGCGVEKENGQEYIILTLGPKTTLAGSEFRGSLHLIFAVR